MNIDAFNTLQPCSHFVQLVNKDCLKFTHDGCGVKAEELLLLRPSTSLDGIGFKKALKTWERQRALSKFFKFHFSLLFY